MRSTSKRGARKRHRDVLVVSECRGFWGYLREGEEHGTRFLCAVCLRRYTATDGDENIILCDVCEGSAHKDCSLPVARYSNKRYAWRCVTCVATD